MAAALKLVNKVEPKGKKKAVEYTLPAESRHREWAKVAPKTDDDGGKMREWLRKYMYRFKSFSVPDESLARSIQMFVFLQLNMTTMKPEMCTKWAPKHTMRYIMSHLKSPYDRKADNLIRPDISFPGVPGMAAWNSSSHTPYIRKKLEESLNALNILFPFDDIHSQDIVLESWADLREVVSNNPGAIDDCLFPISGMNYGNGVDTMTNIFFMDGRDPRQPNRIMVSADYEERGYDETIQSKVARVGMYSYHLCEPACFQCRPCKDGGLEPLMELGVEVWKMIRPYLYDNGCMSYACPPNTCQGVVHFGNGDIAAHQDMNPLMGIDLHDNSQCVGSAVIGISLYAEQIFALLNKPFPYHKTARCTHENMAKDASGKYIAFQTNHGQIYVLLPDADIKYYHHVVRRQRLAV